MTQVTRTTGEFDFSRALFLCRNNLRLKLTQWPEGKYVFLGVTQCIAAHASILLTLAEEAVDKDKMKPCLFMVEGGFVVPWTPSQEELLATNWVAIRSPEPKENDAQTT